jgi:hypothetical protein
MIHLTCDAPAEPRHEDYCIAISPEALTISEARAAAGIAGWATNGDQDLCPRHAGWPTR